MSNKFVTFLFIAAAVLSVLLAGLLVYIFVLQKNVLDEVVIKRDEVTEVELVVDDLQITPGAKKDYNVVLKAKDTGNYQLSILYDETVNGGMKDFVDVKIYYAGELIYNGTLTELVDGYEIVKNISIERGVLYDLTFEYSMSDTVGNEAQKTTTSFDILISVLKED